jgi:hypothetical protein
MTPNVWRMGALPKMYYRNVSGSGQDFRIFPFYVGVVDGSFWYVLKHSFTADNSVIMRPISQVPIVGCFCPAMRILTKAIVFFFSSESKPGK